MNWRTLFIEHKQIVAAVIAGTFAIVAALIGKNKRPDSHGGSRPYLRLLLLPLLYLLVGASFLAAEFFSVNVKPDGNLNTDNPGAILCVAGCVLVVGGVVWLPINIIRLIAWPKPKERPVALQAAQSSDSIPPPPKKIAHSLPGGELMLNTRIACPTCGKRLKTTEPIALGDRIRCPGCQQSFNVKAKHLRPPSSEDTNV